MITTIIASKILWQTCNPRNLESPVKMFEIADRLGDLEKYRAQLKNTEEFLFAFRSLDKPSKIQLLKGWLKDAQLAEARLKPEVSKFVELKRSYKWRDEMDQYDLSKIDLILLSDNKRPIFHTEFWLRNLYSSEFRSDFLGRISKGINRLPTVSGNNLTYLELPSPSFDPFMSDEARVARAWIGSGLKDSTIYAMTPEIMAGKMAKLRLKIGNAKKHKGGD